MTAQETSIPVGSGDSYSKEEKNMKSHDTDSSSGQVDAVEEAIVPSANLMVVDKATERAILRKLDYRIVPMVSCSVVFVVIIKIQEELPC